VKTWPIPLPALAACLVVWTWPVAVRATAGNPIADALDRWDLAAAQAWIDQADPSGRSRSLAGVRGAMLFLQGEYEAAETVLAAADDADATTLRARVRDTRAVTAGLATAWSPSRRFVARFAPGPDEAVLPYLLEAAEAAFDVLSARLGMTVPVPVRIEILPSIDALSVVSATDRGDLVRSGAVAVADFNKLMVLSPSQLPHGYPFADTVAHELAHHFLTVRAGHRVPVWFQEAVAKYLEPAWRGASPGTLHRSLAGLLADARAGGRLVRFDELRQSLSRMPSPERTALAFAQLSSFAAFLVRTEGDDVLSRMADEFRVGDEEVAVLRATGKTLDELQAAWLRAYDAEGRPADTGGVRGILVRESGPPEATLSTAQAALLRLGDLLRRRGHPGQAAERYARIVVPGAHPLLVARLASAWNEAGEPARALAALDRAGLDEVEWAMLARERGRALVAMGRHAEAEAPLLAAVRTDPYDPGTHEALARVMAALGRPAEADREQRLAAMWR
jgi:Flp pilus assembly protein TadD